MSLKLKKFFSFLSLVLLGLLFPFHFASAATWLTDLVLWLPSRTILLVVWLAVKLAILLVGLAGSLLNWVLSPDFINLSYTNPANNPVIETGLGITQGFVNMLLVLVLVYIAIATILRLRDYQAQKLLPIFIIVALLVNFAPVICGLIVDASNIIMNFFVQDLKADVFGQTMGSKVSKMLGDSEWTGLDIGNVFETVFQLLIMVGFLLTLTLVLLIFTVIFILRYLVIWLLVILSPLAFVCYILPSTRKYFDQWWEQFLAWSFIGVSCGFFLYLGLLMVSLVPTKISTPATGQGGLFDPILPFFVSVIFLGLGIVFGLQTSAMGAKTAINIASTKGKTVGKWAGRQTAGRFLASSWGKKTIEAAEKLRSKIPTMSGAKSITGFAGGAVAALTGVRWALRGVSYAGARYGASQEKRILDEKKKIEEKFGDDYERAAVTYGSILPTNYHKKIAMARYISEKKGARGLDKLNDSQLKEVVKLTARYSSGKLKDIIKHKSELIDDKEIGGLVKNSLVSGGINKDEKGEYKDRDVKELINLGVSEADAVRKAAFKKAIDALKTDDVDNLSTVTIETPEFQEMVTRFKPWNFIRKIGEERGLNYIGKLQDYAEKEIGVKEIAKTNPSLLRVTYTPAGGIFLRDWKDKKGNIIGSKKEMDEIIKRVSISPKPPNGGQPKTTPNTIGEVKGKAKTIGDVIREKKNKK